MRGEDLRELAALAKLDVGADSDALRARIETALNHFAILQGVNTEGVEASAYPVAIPHRSRPDSAEAPLDPERVLRNAPQSRSGCFLVPRVVDG